MENTLERTNSKLENSEEQITNLKDRVVEIAQSEQKGKKSEASLREFWDNIKLINIHIIRVPEKKRERGRKPIWRNDQWKLP